MTKTKLAATALVPIAALAFYAAGRSDATNHHSTEALVACLHNPAYIGVTQEDTNNLLAQCVEDYKDSGVPLKVVQAMDSGYDCWQEIDPVKNKSEWLCK